MVMAKILIVIVMMKTVEDHEDEGQQ